MIRQLRNSAFSSILWTLMAFYLLNISVDSADPNPSHTPENLAFNDQESIIEIVLEKILGYEDAIKEYDDIDSEDHNFKKNVKLDLFHSMAPRSTITQSFFPTKPQKFSEYNLFLVLGFPRLHTPPPKI